MEIGDPPFNKPGTLKKKRIGQNAEAETRRIRTKDFAEPFELQHWNQHTQSEHENRSSISHSYAALLFCLSISSR